SDTCKVRLRLFLNYVEISSFHINSTVTSRYAITVITSRVKNRHTDSKEIHFEVKIPKNAFISKFRMTIEGKTYDGVVKEKEAAQQQYSEAVARGESAGVVSSVGRTLEEFKTSVTVAALSKVTFELTYEELLQRRHGKYDLLINAQPMQPVADFKIDVYIKENPDISFLEVKGDLYTDELANAVTTTRSGKEAWIHFYPTSDQQTKCLRCTADGLDGDLIITYDVERTNPNGDIQIMNDYFVHFFAPANLVRIPKNVIFIIDRSGSMSGRKIQQTRSALDHILGDLDRDDHFGLILFDSRVDVWKRELIQATSSNVNLAKQFVETIQARGATNINDAVLKGVAMLNKHQREGSASILILLTDGAPNEGESDPARIRVNVKEAIGGKFPLYSLGFGFDVNFDFLEKMALENSGLARRIYEDSDASDQLQGFYKEVATPLLSDLELLYEGASNLTETAYSMYYNGSEIIVAGEITNNSLESFKVEVVAFSRSNKVTYEEDVSLKALPDVEPQHENFTRRVWAYLKVKQLLKKETTFPAIFSSITEFSMNGELTQSGTGFDQIALHYKTDHHLSVSTADINFSDGQKAFRLVWGQVPTKHEADGVSVNLRDCELDVTLHLFCKVLFFNVNGCFIIFRSTAKDYRLSSAPIVGCWVVRLQFALQGELSDFTVAQL
uniref:Zgc:112265 n=1 Tax=Astyanax mexicanus TaxID=7994 RepID=A0A8B9R948_ASTMX